MSLFTQTGVAIVTPMDGDAIDYDSTERLVYNMEINRVNAIVALGTTGEASTLNEEQKTDFVRFIRTKTRLPLIVGCGGNNTEKVVEDAKTAQHLGADGLLIVTPYYNKCTQNGLIEHYRYVCNRVSLPVIAYNVPGRTGFNLLPETAAKLAEIKGMCGIKEASGNMNQIMRCINAVRGGLDVYSGDDGLTVPVMCQGGKGVISVAANVIPAVFSKMTSLCEGGNFAAAGEIQQQLLPLIDLLFVEVNPIPVRAALSLMGYRLGKPRLPMTEMEEKNLLLLKHEMNKLGLI